MPRRMRATHVITRLIVGGAQENTVFSVLGLRRKRGLEVDLISGPTKGPEGSLEPLFTGQPDALRVLPELVRPIRPFSDWLAFRKLTGIFRSERPEIIHTHSGKAGVIGRLAAAKAGVPIVIHTIHGPSFGAFQGWLSNLLFTAAERRAGRVTTHFVVVADAMRDQYLAAGIGKPELFTKIYSGFVTEPFLAAKNDLAVRASLGIRADDVVVGKIARLTELKGHDDLFEIVPKLVAREPRLKVLVVGDGPWRARFEAEARSIGARDRFVFTGLVHPEKVPQFVGIMDILVHLSLREGLPRALPQALAAGKPVVAYDCDGAREICVENETGFLAPRGNKEVVRDRLLQLAREPALRERLGSRGRQLVADRFPTHKMVDDLAALYWRLAAEKGLPDRPPCSSTRRGAADS